METLSHSAGEAARDGEPGMERLRVCALLFEQAAEKRSRGELMEALELRAEARALRREGYAMLGGPQASSSGPRACGPLRLR